MFVHIRAIVSDIDYLRNGCICSFSNIFVISYHILLSADGVGIQLPSLRYTVVWYLWNLYPMCLSSYDMVGIVIHFQRWSFKHLIAHQDWFKLKIIYYQYRNFQNILNTKNIVMVIAFPMQFKYSRKYLIYKAKYKVLTCHPVYYFLDSLLVGTHNRL